jgi:hypothetical protein
MGPVELCGERGELLQRPLVVGLRPRLPEPAFDEITVTVGEVVKHGAFLVDLAALDRGPDAEHVVHRGAQRLGAVDHDEHALLDFQAAVHEVR